MPLVWYRVQAPAPSLRGRRDRRVQPGQPRRVALLDLGACVGTIYQGPVGERHPLDPRPDAGACCGAFATTMCYRVG